MGNYRSSELREMREALRVFTDAYVAYLQNPSSQGRSQVLRAMPEAEMALSTGGGGMTFTDPPAMGPARQQYTGLPATAFLHERFAWQEVNDRPTYEFVLEGIEGADAVLAVAERQARGRACLEDRPVCLGDAAASGRGRGRCRRRLRRRPAARALVIEAAVARVVGVLLGPDTP